jgi:hypothetical protein
MREVRINPSFPGLCDPRSPCYRWVPSRKLALLNDVSSGKLSIEEAGHHFGVSMDELISWQAMLEQFGPKGLYATPQLRRRTFIQG